MNAVAYATKQDVEEIVNRVVGEIVRDALQLISERFDRIEKRLDRIEARLDHMEDKLDRTAAIVDLHAVDIRALQRKVA